MPSNMSKFLISKESSAQLIRFGQRVRIARIRRGLSIADLANMAGINRNTLAALELGKPGTAIGVRFDVLEALGLEKSLEVVVDPHIDHRGKELEASRRPTRMCLSRNDNPMEVRRVDLHRRISLAGRDDRRAQGKALAMSPLCAIPAHIDQAESP